jgi:stearoyl-CoA desaturase (delta-9 desaturase)
LVLLPAAWALAFGGPEHVVGTVLVGGFLRTFIFLNGVMGTNSLAHYFGYRRYHDVGEATNNWFITVLTLGDGWHNNHHAQPRAASNRVGWWELDFNGWTIETLGKMGLVWNVQKRDKNRPAGYPEPHEMVGKPVMAFVEPAKAHSKADELVA